jgi:acetyltransferase-like isoleucine patch superfamily enzyme
MMAKLISSRLWLAQLILRLLPETRCFRCKRLLLCFAGAEIAANTRICSSVSVLGSGSLQVGSDTWIGHQVLLVASASISIGSHVDIGPRVFIGTGSHEIDAEGLRSAGTGVSSQIVIEDGAWIGAGAMIMPGVTVGTKAVVGAGALVRGDVPSGNIVAGVPVRKIGHIHDKKRA